MVISIAQGKKFKNVVRLPDGHLAQITHEAVMRWHLFWIVEHILEVETPRELLYLHDYDGNDKDQSDGNKYLQFEM